MPYFLGENVPDTFNSPGDVNLMMEILIWILKNVKIVNN